MPGYALASADEAAFIGFRPNRLSTCAAAISRSRALAAASLVSGAAASAIAGNPAMLPGSLYGLGTDQCSSSYRRKSYMLSLRGAVAFAQPSSHSRRPAGAACG